MSDTTSNSPDLPGSAKSNSKFAVLFDQAIVSATNFLTTIIIGNACGADQLGIYAVGFSVVLLSMAFESSMVSTPFTVFVQKDESHDIQSRSGSALTNLLGVSVCILIIQVIIWLIARPYLDVRYDAIFQIVLITTPFIVARAFIRKFLLATFQAKKLLGFDLLVCLTQIACLATLAWSESISPTVALLAVGGCNLLGLLLFLIAWRRQFRFQRETIKQQIRGDWRFGKWLVGEQTLTIMSVYGAPWLLALLMDSTAVGIFAACCSITGLANPFLIGLGNYLLPRFSNEYANQSQTQKTYWYYMSLTFVAMTIFAFICLTFSNQLLNVFYPEESYGGYGMVLGILSIRVLVGSLGLVSHYALLAMQKPKISLYASIVCITILIVSSLILIPGYGLLGGAIAWSLAAVAESMVMIICFQIYIQSKKLEASVSNKVASQVN